ncbi:MAG: monooxygenase [Proteobacteria bacterium]|nr:MAG: monooxygenase [Pseudomonadota bacterium]
MDSIQTVKKSTSIAIIGAGIGGLSAALALQSRGFGVRVFEQAHALGEIGAGLHLSPNGLKVLNALGLERGLSLVAARPTAISIKHFATGSSNFESRFDDQFERRFGTPFYSFHRADLHATLSRAVIEFDPDCISLKHQAVNIVDGNDGVTVEFDNGATEQTEILIAADGVHSRVRASVHGELDARFTGHVAYRGMVATETLPPNFVEPKFNVWVGPGKHFVAYPVRRGELINYVALIEEDGWQGESWTTKADKEVFARNFKGWNEIVRALVDLTLQGECYKWALLVRDPLPTWSTKRVTLLGDAAHPMVPYLAQGAAMAVEDAWVLAACIERGANCATALRNYEQARLERTTKMQAASWEQGQLNHAVGRSDDEFRGGGFADPSWIYSYDATELFPRRST